MPNPTPRISTIQTERLILRPMTEDDLDSLVYVANDPDVAANTRTFLYPFTRADAEARWERQREKRESGDALNFAIALKTPGDEPNPVVGNAGLHLDKKNDSAEIGYMIAKDHRGHGYATEAARALINWGFDTLGLNRITAAYLARNPASGRIIQNLGMVPEGVRRQVTKKGDAYEDEIWFSLLRSDPRPPAKPRPQP